MPNSTFPKINLRYPNVLAFARFARKGFEQGRVSLRLKKEFNPGQRIVMIFHLTDRPQPIEIIGQIIDKVKEKDGFIYGVRFLNFTEKKLQRILEGKEPKVKKTEKPEAKVQPQEPAPSPKEPAEQKEEKPVISKEPAFEQEAEEKAEAEPPSAISSPSFAEKQEALETKEPEKPAIKEVEESEEEIEEFVIEKNQIPQTFDGRELAEEKEEQKEIIAPQAEEEIKEEEEPVPVLEKETAEEGAVQEISAQKAEGEEELETAFSQMESQELPTLAEQESKEEAVPLEQIEEAEHKFLEQASPESPVQPEELAPEEKPPAELEEEKSREEKFAPLSPELLSDFLFRVVRLVLNPPDPELEDTKKQFSQLYELFQQIMAERDRLGIYLMMSSAGKDFLVEGAQEKPRSIRLLLPQEQMGTLLFRLIEVFDEKELLGIVFRKYLTVEHLQEILLALGRFNPEKDSPDQLVLNLIKSGIYHFNLIFEVDLVAVPEQIREEAKIILARINGELKRLKALSQQISEDPLALLTLRLEDIFFIAQDPELIAQVLEYLSLIESIKDAEISLSGLEEQVLFIIPISLLVGAVEILIKKLSSIPSEKEQERKRIEQVLRKVLARMAYEAPEQALTPLAQLFERKVIKYEELPEGIRDQVASSMLAQEFLQKPDEKLVALDSESDPAQYRRKASQLLWASLALLEEGKIKESERIFGKLVEHIKASSHPFPERAKLARKILAQLSEPMAVEILLKVLKSGKVEARKLCASMLYAGGVGCVPKLLELLEKSEDRQVRRLICEIIARFGRKIESELYAKITQPDAPWYFIRNLLMILAQIKSPVLVDNIGEYLAHPHPRVREEAIRYIFSVKEKDSESYLAQALSDQALSVKVVALNHLLKLDEISETTLGSVKKLLDELIKSEITPEGELGFQRAVELLSRTSKSTFPDQTSINDYLLQLLEQSESRGIFSRAKLDLSPKMKSSLIMALGKRKAEQAQKLISKLAKDKNELIKSTAQKALEEIKS